MKTAKQHFANGWYCAESVLLALCEKMGIESELIPKIASAFCGGVSRTKGNCGAVSGALMAISLKYGRTSPDQSVDEVYKYTQEFLNRFKEEFGTHNCFELINCDLSTEAGQQKFEDENKILSCRNFVRGAEEIAWNLIKPTK